MSKKENTKLKDEMKGKWLDRLFQVGLLILGFAFGILGSQLQGCLEAKAEKKESAKLLYALINRESVKNAKLIETLNKVIEEQSPKMFAPESFEWQYDLTIIHNTYEKIAGLELEIISKYIGYIRMYEQCGSYRNMVVNRLTKIGQNHQVDFETLRAYKSAIEGLEQSAQGLSELIKKRYSF